jgi:hypothetical protein
LPEFLSLKPSHGHRRTDLTLLTFKISGNILGFRRHGPGGRIGRLKCVNIAKFDAEK